MTLRRLFRVGALVVLISLCLPTPKVWAHAQLLDTEPAAGAQLARAPDRVTLRFNEHVDTVPDSMRLFAADGNEIDVGRIERLDGDDRTVTTTVPSLDDGGYVVAWRVVSADSHPIRGAFTFQVGNATAVAPGLVTQILGERTETRSAGALLALGRFASYAGIALLIGVCALVTAILPEPGRRVRQLGWVALAVALVGTLLMIGAQAAAARGTGWSMALRPDGWREVLATQAGGWWGWRFVGLAVASVLVATLRRHESPLWRASALTVGVLVLAVVAAGGHGITGRWVPVGFVATTVHLAAMGLWLGGLVVVVVAVTERPAPAGVDIVGRFSPLAFGAVVGVVASGVANAWRQLGSLTDLTGTTYGQLLAIKTLLVVAMVGLGALSRHIVRGGRLFGAPGPRPRAAGAAALTGPTEAVRLRRNLAVEIGVGLAVLAVTALLVNTRPAFSESGADGGGVVSGQAIQGDRIAIVEVDPGQAGRPVQLHVYLESPGGSRAAPDEITMRASLPERDIGPLEIPVYQAGPNHATTPEARFPLPGRWTIQVIARYGDFEAVTFDIPLDIT